MIKSMLDDLLSIEKDKNSSDCSMINKLVQGSKSKKYVPLMKRQKCGMYLKVL